MSHAISAKPRKGANTSKSKNIRPLSNNQKINNPNRSFNTTTSNKNDSTSSSSSSASHKHTHLRDKSTINRLAMYKQRAVHDRHGHFLTGPYMSRTPDEPIKRISPNRKWFGNTRVIGQQQLSTFRTEMK